MKKFTKIFACVLALAVMLVSLAACGDMTGGTTPAGSAAPAGSTPAQGGASTPLIGDGPAAQLEGHEYIDGTNIDVTGMPDKDLTNPKVTIYCWDDKMLEKLYDWTGFRFIDYYGGEVEIIVASGDYYGNLNNLIAAGEIPDVVVGEAQSFPMFMMRGLVQPWDPYVDFADPIWQQTGAMADIDKMRYEGQVYNITHRAHTLGVMFYNKKLISDSGMEDPAALQARGEWTWDAFAEYLDANTVDTDGDGVFDVHGLVNTGDFPIALFASTGELPIEYDGATFVNNLMNPSVQAAANYLYDIGNSGRQFMSLGDPVAEFQNGKAAFVYTNDYRGYEDYMALWGTDGVGVVPMPRYPDAAEQYQAALTDNFWLMKNAQNPEGAALLMLAMQYDRQLNVSPAAGSKEESEIQDLVTRGFSQEAAEATVAIRQMPTEILWPRNIVLTDGAIEYRAMDIPWTTLADSASGQVDSAIAAAMTPQ